MSETVKINDTDTGGSVNKTTESPKESGKEKFIKILKIMGWIVLSIVVVMLLIFMILYWMVRRAVIFVLDWTCGTVVVDLFLMIIPIILEIVGIVTIPIAGIGAIIVGIGTAMEVIGIICDFHNRQYIGLLMSVVGLIPAIGLPVQVGEVGYRAVKKITGFIF